MRSSGDPVLYLNDPTGADRRDRRRFLDSIAKMNQLLISMESAKGNYNIDDPEIRWVTDRIEYWNSEERVLSKQEMQIGNLYWKKYNK